MNQGKILSYPLPPIIRQEANLSKYAWLYSEVHSDIRYGVIRNISRKWYSKFPLLHPIRTHIRLRMSIFNLMPYQRKKFIIAINIWDDSCSVNLQYRNVASELRIIIEDLEEGTMSEHKIVFIMHYKVTQMFIRKKLFFKELAKLLYSISKYSFNDP